ncbi:MAG: YkgJ family cysteine cluster protein [Methanogenium sp.]|jgi:Fe-S-cluster containining protein
MILEKYDENLLGSVVYMFQYIYRLTKHDITITFAKNYKLKVSPPKKVEISEKFFRNFKCSTCGECCSKRPVSLVYLASKAVCFDNYVDDLTVLDIKKCHNFVVKINEKSYEIKAYQNDSKRCRFLKDNLCQIHSIKPLHCALPHMHIDGNKQGIARLTKRQYGRNWLFGCKAKETSFDYNVYRDWDLPLLRKLCDLAQALDLDTWWPEILVYLENLDSMLKNNNIPKQAILIYDSRQEQLVK